MSYRHKPAKMTAQDEIMLRDGYVPIYVVAAALGVHGSTVLRRVQRAAYKGVRAGYCWYLRLDDVMEASDTSEIQRKRLVEAVNVMQAPPPPAIYQEFMCPACVRTRTHIRQGEQPGESGGALWRCTDCGATSSLPEEEKNP